MARGWESKSVEAQQEQAGEGAVAAKPRLTREQADQIRERDGLRLSLKKIVAQLDQARNPAHREMLEKARLELEWRIGKLNP